MTSSPTPLSVRKQTLFAVLSGSIASVLTLAGLAIYERTIWIDTLLEISRRPGIPNADVEAALASRPAQAIPKLGRHVLDEAAPIDSRIRAIEILVKTEDPRAFAPLMGALDCRETRVRVAATRGLGSFVHEDALAGLAVALRDSDPQVRAAAALPLARYFTFKVTRSGGRRGDPKGGGAPPPPDEERPLGDPVLRRALCLALAASADPDPGVAAEGRKGLVAAIQQNALAWEPLPGRAERILAESR